MPKKVLSLLIVILLITIGCSKKSSADNTVKEFSAVIDYIEGEVLLNNNKAETGIVLAPGSVIKTAEGAICDIIFGDKNIIHVTENTELNISIAEETGSIDIKKGAIAALFSKLKVLTLEDTFKIKTASVTAGLRGTAFFIKTEDENNSYVCTCYGKLELEASDKSKTIDSEAYHHGAYRFTKTDSKVNITEAELLYHSDEEMDAIASKIEEKINWAD